MAEVKALCDRKGVPMEVSRAFELGGKGSLKLAQTVVGVCSDKPMFKRTYEDEDPTRVKIEKHR